MTDEELIYNQCIYTDGAPAHIAKKIMNIYGILCLNVKHTQKYPVMKT